MYVVSMLDYFTEELWRHIRPITFFHNAVIQFLLQNIGELFAHALHIDHVTARAQWANSIRVPSYGVTPHVINRNLHIRVNKYSLLVHRIKIKSPAKFLGTKRFWGWIYLF